LPGVYRYILVAVSNQGYFKSRLCPMYVLQINKPMQLRQKLLVTPSKIPRKLNLGVLTMTETRRKKMWTTSWLIECLNYNTNSLQIIANLLLLYFKVLMLRVKMEQFVPQSCYIKPFKVPSSEDVLQIISGVFICRFPRRARLPYIIDLITRTSLRYQSIIWSLIARCSSSE
jgi:hypothetical protein